MYTNTVSPGYFRTLGIPIVQGRDFSPRNTEGAPLVAIVTQKLAARLWPGENPLGKRIAVPSYQGPRRPPVQVIGVAKDSKYQTLLADPPLLLYVPLLQNREVFVSIEVRTIGDAAAFAPVLEHEVAALDRNLPLHELKTLSDQIMSSLWKQRTAAGLIGLFAAPRWRSRAWGCTAFLRTLSCTAHAKSAFAWPSGRNRAMCLPWSYETA
ncbi:MAG: hypothetical protein DMG57_39990 [Acidobacteria bacterium]|nr:MAG: hypothetical protein DMG57_39990 [Acidobacteriota bacterium]